MTSGPATSTDVPLSGVRPDGLAVLGPEQVAVRAELEAGFAELLAGFGAVEVELPRLISLADAAAIDYFQNFPQLGLAVSGLADPESVATRAKAGDQSISAGDLAAPVHVLPSAACYGLYFALRGARMPELSLFTVRGHCFRRESHYDQLDRLLGFTMREVIAIGAHDAVADFVGQAKDTLLGVAARFGVDAALAPATDPFFEADGPRVRMQRLLPVKHELVSGRGVALGSANFHRTFFGDRCDITLESGGDSVSTGCLGLGIERWIGELTRRDAP